jgi:hypothetical protein
MKVTWYPANALLAVVILIICVAALDLASDASRGAATGVAALIAYLSVDTVLTVNPAQWWGRDRAYRRRDNRTSTSPRP